MNAPSILGRKRGFNLIEIAIVLAVIGLVIGGIYMAASAISENNRQLTMKRQVIQIAQNVRSVYATQNKFTALTFQQVKALNLFPGDLDQTMSQFITPYNDLVSLKVSTSSDQNFVISYGSLPTGSCIKVLVSLFGSGQTVRQLGLVGLSGPIYALTPAQVADGISFEDAAYICGYFLNPIRFEFSLRG